MKKTLFTTSLLALFAGSSFAGTATEAPLNSTCTLWQAFKAKPQAFEVSAVNAISSEIEIPNLWGPRFTWSMFTPAITDETLTHEFNASVGMLWGSEDNTDMYEMPFAIGYNAVYTLAPSWDVYAGTKLSLSYTDVEWFGAKDKDVLFGLSLCLGVRHSLTESLYASFAYEYKYTFANVSNNYVPNGADAGDIQGQHILALGVGYTF